ncbi:MAG: glycoside hydrolase family 3 N-terminal domain-containing protein [Clostridium sp.]
MGKKIETNEQIDIKITELISKMTLKEKVGQLNQKLYGWNAYKKTKDGYILTDEFKEHVKWGGGIGALYGIFRADPWSGVNFDNGIEKKDSIKIVNMIQKYVKENTRLGIPVLFSEECPHGHQALDSELYPCNIGIGSTWNTDLVKNIGDNIAVELRAKGANLALVSTLDVLRDPRWGRSEECYGEDPHLSAEMTKSMVIGLQGDCKYGIIRDDKVVAVLKHLCAQGQAEGGHNSAAANIGERELREIHLPPVKAGVDAGALAVMAAYNEIDGIPCHANRKLLTATLREEYGFKGLVMADGCALDRLLYMTRDKELAAKVGLNAGVDLSLWDDVYTNIESAVNNGVIKEDIIDKAVYRVLYVKFKLGLFKEESTSFLKQENSDINKQAARESIVLLKNENILPLSSKIKNIAVIGPNANNIYNQLGDYTSPQRENKVVTVLNGIRAKAPNGVMVKYAKGCNVRNKSKEGFKEAVELAKSSDVAILVLGGSSARNFGMRFESNGAVISNYEKQEMDCGENVDLANLELGGVQVDLVKEIIKTGTKVVVILIQGRPHSIEYIKENCDGILCGWYPGQLGGEAIAEILFGEQNPSGKLPVSIPVSSMQLPIYYNGKENGAKVDYYDILGKASYPFGYGLSYSEYRYSDIRLSRNTISVDELKSNIKINVSIRVKNVGSMNGNEVIQLYIKDMEASITRRFKELKGFKKEHFNINEEKIVEFELGFDELAIWDIDMNNVVEPGEVKIMVGKNSIEYEEVILKITQ